MKATQAGRIGQRGLPTSRKQVQELQKSLHAKAKAEPSCRFYSLWDKVCRDDILREAYRRCRINGGAAGTDGVTFDDIE
jgi:RNA-directed DNA polymerase